MRGTTRYIEWACSSATGSLSLVAALVVACACGPRLGVATPTQPALVIPFELRDNHILVQVSVDGSRALTFALDTGSPLNLVGLRQARSLGLPIESIGTVIHGVGANPPEAYVVTRQPTLRVGEASLAAQVLIAVPLDLPPECSGPPGGRVDSARDVDGGASASMDGVLGKPIFDRFVVDIDYAARRITLHEPHRYRYEGRGEVLSLQMVDGVHPVVTARVTGPGGNRATARLHVDLGAGTAITINMPFAELNRILPPAGALRAATECGLGGAAAGISFEGLLDSVTIGRTTLLKPMTFFRRHPKGRGFDGLIGGGALRDFRLILDYSRGRLIWERAPSPAR